ncbi:MAG TPA: hypothetical protein DHU33_05725 [Firmicutes bacterium]|nr:hypothetical protein [Bacillota bacterium]
MNININKDLEKIKLEDYIWYIYLFIVAFNLYSNYLEKQYITTGDTQARDKFRLINNIVLSVILVIYLIFLYAAFKDITDLKHNDSAMKKRLTTLAVIAALLFVIAGAITLYVSLKKPALDDEIAII